MIATFAKAYWESFVELNLCGSTIVLLEKNKFRAYKMSMLKDIASLSVMKPRCEELGKRKVLFLLILASVGEKSRHKSLFQVGQRWVFVI